MKLYLARHAAAGDRHGWSGPDRERPLSKKGRAQAEELAEALAGLGGGTRVLSSPAVRCLQTVGPLAARIGAEIEPNETFAEGAPLRGALELLDEVIAAGKHTVICGHGDLIPEYLESLEREGVPLDGFGCAKGSVWQLVVKQGRVVRGEYHRHPLPGLARPSS